MVEPPGGNPLRELSGWPGLARGKKSVSLDLHTESGLVSLRRLLTTADVLITTSRPAALERLGLTAAELAEINPRLVSAAITGWGSTGPWKDTKGYEALILARMGVFFGKRQMTERSGPAFTPTPYASWGAAQAALHGILAALYERETSGVGQRVEADLLRGAASMDTYNWFFELVCKRWPGAFEPMAAFADDGTPHAPLIYPLLVAPTKDGHWLQFAQTEARLFQAFIVELGLGHIFTDPYWEGLPTFEDVERRVELWEMMLGKVRERTLEEWNQVRETNPNVGFELYSSANEAFQHPQLQHDGRVVTIEDPELGPVTQPSTLVHIDGQPMSTPTSAPKLGADTAALLAELDKAPAPQPAPAADGSLPLAGVTILELGSMFAAPYGATVLTDLGARVYKVETLEGDTMRRLVAFPEAGGARVLQGKESIALDLTTEEGLAIVHELAKRSDIVLQSYRAGAAERAKVDAATLKALNPDLIYLNAPGYGTDGPYGGRPAYAPSIDAASGLALSDLGGITIPNGDLEEIKRGVVRLHTAAANPSVQADAIAALACGTAMTMGLFARARGRAVGEMTTTMLASATHALMDRNIEYAGRPTPPQSDPDLYGLNALYRMYQSADGWVFLAAPQESEWVDLAKALQDHVSLDDPRFATARSRADNDAFLAETLGRVFATKAGLEWENDLTAANVGCVVVTEESAELHLQNDEYFEAGYSVLADSPVFDEHRRLAPITTFSRSAVKADGGCTVGQHTDSLLAEIGYDDARIADLRDRKVVV